jgi:hypothetical protein
VRFERELTADSDTVPTDLEAASAPDKVWIFLEDKFLDDISPLSYQLQISLTQHIRQDKMDKMFRLIKSL